jgi:hypothetical protein
MDVKRQKFDALLDAIYVVEWSDESANDVGKRNVVEVPDELTSVRRHTLQARWSPPRSFHLNGEMSEWLKEHAWKSTLSARADAHQIVRTHFPINNFRCNNLRRYVPVNDALHQGFRGVCDTVLTQRRTLVKRTLMDAQRRVHCR